MQCSIAVQLDSVLLLLIRGLLAVSAPLTPAHCPPRGAKGERTGKRYPAVDRSRSQAVNCQANWLGLFTLRRNEETLDEPIESKLLFRKESRHLCSDASDVRRVGQGRGGTTLICHSITNVAAHAMPRDRRPTSVL